MTLPLGAVMISPDSGGLNEQRRVFREAKMTVLKAHTPEGFGTSPSDIEAFIHDGATTVILRTEDAGNTPEQVEAELFDRGFVDLMQRHPQVTFWLQVGNEPSHYHGGPPEPEAYRDELLAVYDGLANHPELARLRWIAGIPVNLRYYDVLMRRDAIVDRYDALGVNRYGIWSIGDTDTDMETIYQRCLRLVHPIWIVEAGIAGELPTDEKGRRVVDFWHSLNESRMTRRQMLGVVLFALGTGTRWPQYEINSAMAAELAARDVRRERHFPQTGYTIRDPFLEAWERYGGIPVLGYPISPEIEEDGRTVLYTERWRLEHHPEHAGSQWEVLGGHLGREVYEQRYGGA